MIVKDDSFLWKSDYRQFLNCSKITHSSVDKHLACFHILTTVNNAAINMEVQIFLQDNNFIFFG